MKHRFSAPIRADVASLLVSGLLLAAGAAAEESGESTKHARRQAKSAHDRCAEHARCTVRKDANGWWLVSPAGEPFFSLGVCMFNQGSDKEDYDPAKPSYAALATL